MLGKTEMSKCFATLCKVKKEKLYIVYCVFSNGLIHYLLCEETSKNKWKSNLYDTEKAMRFVNTSGLLNSTTKNVAV